MRRNSRVAFAALALAMSTFLLPGHAAAQGDGPPNAVIIGALKPTAAPRFSPAVAPNQDLVSIPVTYAYTGVLRSEVKSVFRLFVGGPKPIPAGTVVFGIPTNLPSGLAPRPGLLWCAVSPPATSETTWSVTCFPRVPLLFHKTEVAFVPLGPNLFPARFAVARDHDTATPAPDIEERRVDLAPPLSVSVQFAGWDNNLANLRVVVHQPAYSQFKLLGGSYIAFASQVVGRLHLPRDASGGAHLPLFGGEILIRPGADGKSAAAELARPFI
ncbi:MAG TPA: hypothetical protein VG166_14215 [Caulobacteraceae bacterium]|jgi:hypothetical protein|nr:hypothetical protein [Caulobacteraceae bacterium]